MISGLMKLSLLVLAFLPDTLYVARKLFFTIWACGVRGLRGTPLGGKAKKIPGNPLFGIQNAPSLVSFLTKIEGTNYADKIS